MMLSLLLSITLLIVLRYKGRAKRAIDISIIYLNKLINVLKLR